MRKHYFLFRVHGDQFRMEQANTVEEACKLAFGTVYKYPYAGSVVYKDIGTKSPKYIPQKVKQEWYKDEGWKVIGQPTKKEALIHIEEERASKAMKDAVNSTEFTLKPTQQEESNYY